MATFTDVFEKLGTHLKNAQQSYGEADKRLEKTQNTLDSLVGTSAADASLRTARARLRFRRRLARRLARSSLEKTRTGKRASN